MKRMDKFVKEKLDKWDEAENVDIVVPDSSACKNKIRMQLEARQVKKKRKIILGFSMGGLATVATILIIVFTVILAPTFVYTDKDLIAYHVSIDELRNNYGVLAISEGYDNFNIKESYLYKHKDTDVAIYSKIIYGKGEDTLELTVVFVDNYKIFDDNIFSNLTSEYKDGRFRGTYKIKDDNLYAKLKNDSKQYFMKVITVGDDNVSEDADSPNGVGLEIESILDLLQ